MSLRLPPGETLIRAAVVLEIAGLLLLVGILFRVGALFVGLFMLGSALIVAGVVLYLLAVVRDLRRRQAL